ncbi:MAG: patatin-like phospholipase family protein [Pelolinea sp.]|nr:patatin-like phospholipase family protein [Pelolinea sp.]
MKPFRKNVAIAIDGGGMRGIIVTQALATLEDALGATTHDMFHLTVGTSTGSIISAGIAAGISAKRMTELYVELGNSIFPNTLRKKLFPLTSYRYSSKPLERALANQFGDMKMRDLWNSGQRTDLVISAYDLAENKTKFIKPWKEEYADWPVAKAVQASCTVPTYFPVVENRYIDGGVGSYANPCYIAAYEAKECLNWDPAETTLISIGTGRDLYTYNAEKPPRLYAWDWIGVVLDVFSQSAYDQQVHLVETYFQQLDFRRFQINLREPIAMDDTSQMDILMAYGTRLGRMILSDKTDPAQGIVIKHPGYF